MHPRLQQRGRGGADCSARVLLIPRCAFWNSPRNLHRALRALCVATVCPGVSSVAVAVPASLRTPGHTLAATQPLLREQLISRQLDSRSSLPHSLCSGPCSGLPLATRPANPNASLTSALISVSPPTRPSKLLVLRAAAAGQSASLPPLPPCLPCLLPAASPTICFMRQALDHIS